MFFLIGVDDTDAPGTEGTCRLAERLGLTLQQRHYGRLVSITRHMLLHHADIYYTTSNSAVCLLLDADADARRDLELTCREYLRRFSTTASDPGFALAAWKDVSPGVVSWGRQAKHIPLIRSSAIELARMHGISIAGFHGTGSGVIGALAAIGLYYSGNDGIFTWLPGLAALQGTLTLPSLLDICSIDRVENERGRRPLERDLIYLGNEPAPVLRDGKSVLLLEAVGRNDPYQWRVFTHAEIERLSS